MTNPIHIRDTHKLGVELLAKVVRTLGRNQQILIEQGINSSEMGSIRHETLKKMLDEVTEDLNELITWDDGEPEEKPYILTGGKQ